MLRMPAAFTSTLLMTSCATADVISTFRNDNPNGTVSGDTFTISATGLFDNGVTFDATLTVTGSGNLTQTGGGLGVAGNGSDFLNLGESLRYTMSISNEVGGTADFNGFTEVDFSNFGPGDTGFLSLDSSELTLDDNFFATTSGGNIVDISATSPTSFFAIGSSTFRINEVSGSFTGTAAAVPEPSSVFLCTVVLGGLGFRQWNARQQRNARRQRKAGKQTVG